MDETDQVSSTTVEGEAEGSVTTEADTSSSVGSKTVSGVPSPDSNLNQKKRKNTDEEETEDEKVRDSPTNNNMDVDEEGNKAKADSESTSAVEVPEVIEIKSTSPEVPEPEVDLRVIFNKQPIPVRISLKKTVGDLKRVIEVTTKVAPELQKVLVKGIPKDDVILQSLGLSNGSKVLVIGTKLDDILSVSTIPTASELKGTGGEGSASETSQNWCSVPRHQKIIDKGIPDDAMPGIRDVRDPLPPHPISGMVGSKGGKIRLTFKLETDELWIGTKERTDKVPISSIRSVVTQPVTGLEHYHIMAIQLGPTEASRVYIYWVPAQFVSAIKNALGA